MSWLLWVVAFYLLGGLWGFARRDLSRSRYPSPEAAEAEIESLAGQYPGICTLEAIGKSSEGRTIKAIRLATSSDVGRPSLLVTAQIHAIEYVGSFVARALARKLAVGYGHDAGITSLLDRANVWIVPLLNPDGARRVWSNGGWTLFAGSRFTAQGVDPNRNFPAAETTGRRGWNTARDKPGSPYYRGPKPLSEPECRAIAELAERQRFRAAINFHSFSGVVFLPSLEGAAQTSAADALAVFQGFFQSHQPHLRYRPVPERSAAIVGQLDPYLLQAFGTPSVTVEVSRPSWEILLPWRLFHFFSWANPSRPEYWAENDVDATIRALAKLAELSAIDAIGSSGHDESRTE